MAARKFVVPTVCLVAGIALGAWGMPGPYLYGTHNGATYRVNRFTGREEYASSKGWVSQQEMVRDSVNSTLGGFKAMFQGATSP